MWSSQKCSDRISVDVRCYSKGMKDYAFSAEGFESVEKLHKYTDAKLKDLQKYIPRKSRESAQFSVHFALDKKLQQKSCRLNLSLPHQKLTASETAEHVYSALDIAAAELKRQMADYKSKHGQHGFRHRIARAMSRQTTDDQTM